MSTVLLQSAWSHFAHTTALRLHPTLLNGQCFGWRRIDGIFSGVIGSRVVSLRERGESIEFSEWRTAAGIASSDAASAGAGAGAGGAGAGLMLPSPPPHLSTLHSELSDYFQLITNMTPLIRHWSESDDRFSSLASVLPGMRVLRQSPWECLIAFICSSNNNIPRIMKMLESLRCAYGEIIGVTEMENELGEKTSLTWHTFPTISVLGDANEIDLRGLGMGYRAKFIKETAAQLNKLGGEDFLLSLRRDSSRVNIRNILISLHGVGPKVADCVALFSLDQIDAIPVDTHVWTIAVRDLDPSLAESKSITPHIYDRVGDLFRARYGTHAGWAHSLLFAAELPMFSQLIPLHIKEEMDRYKLYERNAKASKREISKERKRVRDERTAAETEMTTAAEVPALAIDSSSVDISITATATPSTSSSVSGVKKKKRVVPPKEPPVTVAPMIPLLSTTPVLLVDVNPQSASKGKKRKGGKL